MICIMQSKISMVQDVSKVLWRCAKLSKTSTTRRFVQFARSLESLIEHGLLERVCELLPALEAGGDIFGTRFLEKLEYEYVCEYEIT